MSDPDPAAAFESAYRGSPPAWDIGRAQPAIVALAALGSIAGPVLDAGCGTGENALYLAGLGLEVTGLDGAPSAIARARAKALERGSTATFVLGDALRLNRLERRFATVVDCGLFHVFPDPERARYVAGLAAVVLEGGRVHVLCFSDLEPGGWGPRRVSQAELRAAFADGWRIEAIAAARFDVLDRPQVRAWLASLERR